MLDAPQQDWAAYERRAAAADAAWNQNVTPDKRIALVADMFRMVWNSPRDPVERERLEAWRWRAKVARRLTEVDAYRKLDELRRERSTSHDNR